MERCTTCKHFTPDRDRPPYGSCLRWNTGYSYNQKLMPLDEVLVENDEGWGMAMGPAFGCVLHEQKS
jgi:hypothetical protein